MALGHGSLPCLLTGTVAASWPIRNIMRQENRPPPPLVLHFRVEWGVQIMASCLKAIEERRSYHLHCGHRMFP